MIELNKVYNMDCMDLMKEMIRGGVLADWIITDPPYGLKIAGPIGGDNACRRRDYSLKEWDNSRIGKEYFDLMFQCSKNQIIFGGNYYTDFLPPTKSWIVWDKRCEDRIRNNFGDCEIAWCSQGVARVFRYLYDGMRQGDMINKDERFHPTQKPTQIISKLIAYYTNENDLIFDPFMGSFTTAVCCHRLNRRFLGAELDKEYFDKGQARLQAEMAQLNFFNLIGGNKK